ncbi:MAG TPA: acetate--CoA ligase family protein [Smithellaceae bacterium]|nr:acetate--CoA ligase family protein [Smithellaceae bacterium]
MKPEEVIELAAREGRSTLTEAEAKNLLRCYGIPGVDEVIYNNINEIEAISRGVAYPVVLKGLGSKLTHKTERGLVKLNIQTPDDLMRAAQYIKEAAGEDLEGYLLQPMVEGKREFVAGLFFDPQFGPAIMFGLGGVFTEALEDVVFRLAPVDQIEARQMIGEIQAKKLLRAFRGEKEPDMDALVRVLTGLSEIAMTLPQVCEIDINPLIVSPGGKVTAVDALVVLGPRNQQKVFRPPVDPRHIGNLFYPKSIAFVGASAELSKWGQLMYSNVIAGKFAGKVFLVNPRGGEIAGRNVYQSVLDIPEPIDLAVVTIPANRVIPLIADLQEKEIKNVLLISSGFGETGPEGKALEEELIRKAAAAGILILGPNTMGICNPYISLYCTGTHVRPKAGGTTLVAQSGNMGTQLLAFAEQEGIGIRAFSGSGNESMITIEDYMDGFEVDDLTKTVVMYIESIKNGRRFYESARRVGLKKPVIALKGGRTQAGASAAASHTGAMASNTKVFDAACTQAGVIRADQPMDLLDLSAAFSSLPLPQGNRVAILTLGGGWGVVASDLCSENGLVVQPLSERIVQKINNWLPPFWSHANPVDLVAEMNTDIHMAIADELLQWEECDAIIHMGIIGRRVMIEGVLNSTIAVDTAYDQKFKDDSLELLKAYEYEMVAKTVRIMGKYHKPVIGVYLLTDETTRTVIDIEGEKYKGIVFPSPERAVKVLAKMHRYSQWLHQRA